MATIKDIKKVKGFCDDVYADLAGMKDKIMAMRDNFALTYGEDHELFVTYDRHLRELAEQIEWKLQILSHACPYDWKGSTEYENVVSVEPDKMVPDSDFSGGYVGG